MNLDYDLLFAWVCCFTKMFHVKHYKYKREGLSLSEIIDYVANDVGVKVTTKVNPEFVRPDDNREIVGSSYKIETELGWTAERDIKETLHDMIVERMH